MSLFKESVWDTDETGDKLTKELFVKERKKKDKSKIKLDKIKESSVKKFSKNDRKKPKTVSGSKNTEGAPANGNKFNGIKRKSSEITIDKSIIKKWKFESGANTERKTSAESIITVDRPAEKNLKPGSKGLSNKLDGKKQLNGILSEEIPKKRSKNRKVETEESIAKKAEKQRLKRKKKKLKDSGNSASIELVKVDKESERVRNSKLKIDRLQKLLDDKKKGISKGGKDADKPKSLRDRMLARLKSSRFRFLNEQLYNSESWSSKKYFKEDPDAFSAYHEGYKLQVEQWPLNPLDVIISSVKKMPKDYVVADFGCGEARLASSVSQKVHSLDLVAVNDTVTACDMAHTPLLTNRIDVAVFCLSLMGTNLADYLIEANRVLRKDGILKLAEVESRFEDIDEFVKTLVSYGFVNTWRDLSHNLFYFMDFKKEGDITKKRNKLPPISLKSCSYKKR